MELINSLAKLGESEIRELEETLSEKFGYLHFPDDYREFLQKNNGGFVVPGHIQGTDHDLHKEEVVFKTPLKDGEKDWTPGLYAFFGHPVSDESSESENGRQFPKLVRANDRLNNDFDVLPKGMMAIALCTHPTAGDLLCISLHEKDYGAVYFYFSQWFNPAFGSGDYYESKTNKILDEYNLNSVQEGTENEEAQFAVDRIPFIKLADSFSAFLSSLTVAEVSY
ncbi:MAG: SMI1/KNR4 family protein [Flavobacteriales bacterium]|nr:SMI1/KNR4 family protein [Flavobacteriales bacterium]